MSPSTARMVSYKFHLFFVSRNKTSPDLELQRSIFYTLSLYISAV